MAFVIKYGHVTYHSKAENVGITHSCILIENLVISVINFSSGYVAEVVTFFKQK